MSQLNGFKPKKLITKTILTNPSLYSLSITSLLDPHNNKLEAIYSAIEQKQNLSSSRNPIINIKAPQINPQKTSSRQQYSPTYLSSKVDALQQAEKEFDTSKKHQNTDKIEGIRREASEGAVGIRRGSSVPSLLSFHYTRTREIKDKQSKPFNIINNL